MEVEYEIDDKSYFSCFNEAQGISINKKKILSGKTKGIHGYIEQGMLNMVYALILWVIYALGLAYKLSTVLLVLNIALTAVNVIYFITFFVIYNVEKKKKHVGTLTIDEVGISDKSTEGTLIQFAWNKIDVLVIKKHTVTILTSDQIMYFIKSSKKEEILKAVKEYNKELKIVEL